jgi:O-antigen ligase
MPSFQKLLTSKFLTFTEQIYLIGTFFLATAPIIPLIRTVRSGSDALTHGDPIMQLLWFADYFVLFGLIACHGKQFFVTLTRDRWMLVLILMVIISVTWSAIPLVTVRRSFALICTTFIGVYLGMRYHISTQLRLLAIALGIATMLSLLFALLLPSYGLETSGDYIDQWRGIYHQKNVLGRFMSLGSVVFLLLTLSVKRHRWLYWLGCFLSVALLLQSGSKNALASLLVSLMLIVPAAAMRIHYSIKIPILLLITIFASGVGLFVFIDLEGVFGLMGKDMTLTGRTDLWPSLMAMWQDRPWLGFGYSGFWAGWDGPSEQIWQEFFWHPRHAHNGFLQILLELGIVGVTLFLIRFLTAFPQAIAWVQSTKQAVDLWPLIYLPFMFLSNIAESVVLAQNNLFWILYVAMLTTFADRSADQSLSATSPNVPVPFARGNSHRRANRRSRSYADQLQRASRTR